MDYLRQQIEASLGRSEDLIISDKARRNFYRYPVDYPPFPPPVPPPPLLTKKSSKERSGTFNSVRLMKYLGLGNSKRKSKLDSDDLQQKLQQQAYLEELRRYGPIATIPPPPPPYYDGHGPIAMHYPSHHPAACYLDAWPSEGGTVRARNIGHYPSVCASVGSRRARSRGSLQNVIYAWDQPFLQSPRVASLADLSPRTPRQDPEVFECPCNCEEHILKGKKHRSQCTCSSGMKSTRRSKMAPRPPLFGGNKAGGHDAVVELYRRLDDPDSKIQKSAGCDSDKAPPVPKRVSRSNSNVTKSRLHRLSDVSTMTSNYPNPANVQSFNDGTPKRRSILECSVNPYDLMKKTCEYKRRSAQGPAKQSTADDFDDGLSDILETISIADRRSSITKAHTDINGNSSGVNDGCPESEDEDDAEEGHGDISLGGQRIRLFDTVKGSMSGRNGHASKRPAIPKFARLPPSPPSPPVPKRKSFPGQSAAKPQKKGPDPMAKTLQVSAAAADSDGNDEWKDGCERAQSVASTGLKSAASIDGGATEDRELQQQHKTTITIGGDSTPSERVSYENPNGSGQPPSTSGEAQRPDDCTGPKESDAGSGSGSNSRTIELVDDTKNRSTVITIGQGSAGVGSNRLHLKINFSELPAYLKPILKKVAFNESSTSSEADSSETYGSSPALLRSMVDLRQKQKKHVHFLSNRSSTHSEVSPSSESSVSEIGGPVPSHDGLQSSARAPAEPRAPNDFTKSLYINANSRPDLSEQEDLYDDGTSLATEPAESAPAEPQNSDVGRPRPRLPTSTTHSPEKMAPISNSESSLPVGEPQGRTETASDPTRPPTNKKAPTPPRRRNRTAAARELRKTSLRRSQSDRQVAATADDNGRGESKYRGGNAPIRSNSFQILVPGNHPHHHHHSATTPSLDVNDRVPHSGPSTKPDNNKLSTFCSPNNLNVPADGDTPHKKYICKEIDHQPLYQNSFKDVDFVSNANHVERSTNQSESRPGCQWSSTSNINANTVTTAAATPTDPQPNGWNRMKGPYEVHGPQTRQTNGPPEVDRLVAPLDIAKLRSIPKFLPRPSLGSKHQHVCGRQYRDDAETPSAHREKARTPRPVQWSSDEELYADGFSSTTASSVADNNNDRTKPLPPIPWESTIERSSNSPDYPSDDNAIYEQIAEPLYEEVPDTISHTSVTSATSGSLGHPRKSIFEGASRTEILNYLEDAKERGVENIETAEETELLPEEDEPQDEQNISTKRHHRNRISNVSDLSDSSHTSEESFQNEEAKDSIKQDRSHQSAEVERNDSGVGSETSKPSRLRRQSRLGSSEQVCVDCDQILDPIWDSEGGAHLNPLVCRKCSKKRNERKEIILEFVETEIKYGRDLKIIKEEFHRPMLVAGLLSEELLNNIFLNLDELIDVNVKFSEKLKDALDIALEQGDEDYSTVNVGKVFLESSSMLHAFEAYCVRQGTASLMLTNLEKDKELLRIFLKVSQMENTLLRRLNLNSFLMVPVQRVTKYPLLLNRLYKVTPHHHQDREALREAQMKIEMHLEHINQQAKDLSGMNIWRRISNISNSQRRNLLEPVIGNIKLRKMALEILQWTNEEVRFVMEGRLQYALLTENLWNKREKTFKLSPVHGLLVTLGNPNSNYRPDLADRDFIFPRNTGIREATLVMIKEKNSRFTLLRDPLLLQKCVISAESDEAEIFEIQEFTTKDAYLMKADDPKDTQEWLKMLRYHAKDLGAWRRRRNALANIMINGMVARREWL